MKYACNSSPDAGTEQNCYLNCHRRISACKRIFILNKLLFTHFIHLTVDKNHCLVFFIGTATVLSVLFRFRCPIFCPFVCGTKTSDCPSVDATNRAFFCSKALNRLNNRFLSSSVLFAQTDLLMANRLCESASLNWPVFTKALFKSLNC